MNAKPKKTTKKSGQLFARWIAAVPALRHALRPDSDTMVFRQTHFWSRSILRTIVGTFVAAVL
jgi:hypothetical protein